MQAVYGTVVRDNGAMPIKLVPVSTAGFPQWLERSQNEYAADLITLGDTKEEAHERAAGTLRKSFPDGAPRPDNAVFDLVDHSGSTVGYVWVGRDNSDDPRSWWIWDIVVDPAHRGKGLGRSGMQLAEEYAHSQGATTLGLSVFGFNRAARGLYESLGYETTSVKMRKILSAS